MIPDAMPSRMRLRRTMCRASRPLLIGTASRLGPRIGDVEVVDPFAVFDEVARTVNRHAVV